MTIIPDCLSLKRARAFAAAAFIGAFVVIAPAHAADAADVTLISADPMAGAIQELRAQFQRETGHRLIAEFVSGPMVKQRIDNGEPFDVAISVAPVIDSLIKEGKIAAATRADIASAAVGLGVHPDARRPDIGSVDALKRTLLNAESVAFSADGVGGTYFRTLLGRLGIAQQMKAKLIPMPDDRLARAIPSGQAEMIAGAVPNIANFGADLVGPLPMELQISISFAAGAGTAARDKEAAGKFIDFLRTPAAVAIMTAKGFTPR